MSNVAGSDIVGALDDVLEKEREALLSGNLEAIGRLLEQKESLIEDLSVLDEVEAKALHDLTGKMKRNQDLLDHALAGIRSVAGRLAAMRRVRSSLDTYDANGTKRSVDMTNDPSLEKRA